MSTNQPVEGYYSLRGGEFDEAGTAATELKTALTNYGVPPDNVRRAAVSAFEAGMNVVIHAIAGTLTYEVQDDEVVIKITDMGPGIPDVDKAMTKGFSTAPGWAREKGWGSGLGLPNIENNCDKLVIDSVTGEGTTLEIRVTLGLKK